MYISDSGKLLVFSIIEFYLSIYYDRMNSAFWEFSEEYVICENIFLIVFWLLLYIFGLEEMQLISIYINIVIIQIYYFD